MQRRIYLDNASTTKIHPEVLKTYESLLEKYYANSESLYDEGAEISRMMEKARAAIAGLLGIQSDEVIFTGGSSESNSAAIKGVCLAVPEKKHIVTTSIEHSSIMNACLQMRDLFGYEITFLPVNSEGRVSVEDAIRAIRPDTALVSIMHVNNEVGSVNPINEIGEYVKKHSHAYMHSDLTQALGKTDVDLQYIDLASVSAHKLEGLKGSGLLIRKRHVPMVPLINGGEQEYGYRGGTSNAPANMVFAKTLRLALERRKNEPEIRAMRDALRTKLAEIEGIEFNSPADAVACLLNFSYEKIPSEVMQNALNRKGFLVSARSTCESKSLNPSYVLQAMGFSETRASSCIRVSLSDENTMEEVMAFADAVKEIIQNYG